MSNVIAAATAAANPTTTRVTVQFRDLPGIPPQVQIIRHYGTGTPRRFYSTVRRPYGMTHEQWCEDIRERLASHPENGEVTILPPAIA